jgi:hypothetical protein
VFGRLQPATTSTALQDHNILGRFRQFPESQKNKNKLVAIKINRSYDSPIELLGASAQWAMSFEEKAIIDALSRA